MGGGQFKYDSDMWEFTPVLKAVTGVGQRL